jgi:hypothetical protein
MVDFGKFAVDDGEEIAGPRTGDANVHFALVIVFGDFGAGGAVNENNARFPDGGVFGVADIFDVVVHFDDETGEDAFGHEVFVVVPEDEVLIGVPVGDGAVSGKQMGGDVLAFATGDFVADFELFHELEELVAHVGVLSVGPNVVEVGVAELAQVLADGGVVEDFVDGGGAPVGFEDESVLEDGVFLEVEEDAKFVEETAEAVHLGAIGDVVTAAEVFVFARFDVVAVVVFETVADVEPLVGKGDAFGYEFFEFLLNGGLEFGESPVVVEVGAMGVTEVGEFAA